MTEEELLYSKSHEWVQIEGDACTLGITRFAVDQLTDLVYVELPAIGKQLARGTSFGVVESVKAVSDLYTPVAGLVTAVNQKVADDPSILSADPYGEGWLIKLSLDGAPDTSQLMSKSEYEEMTRQEGN